MLRLEPYDPDWPLAYSIEAERVKTALGRLALRIEHVG
ncbi:MAG: GrpB family protein [Gemmatimonadaceae bacterium]|nr:GrpB family protein [Gemmatimonadaceae bacterium]